MRVPAQTSPEDSLPDVAAQLPERQSREATRSRKRQAGGGAPLCAAALALGTLGTRRQGRKAATARASAWQILASACRGRSRGSMSKSVAAYPSRPRDGYEPSPGSLVTRSRRLRRWERNGAACCAAAWRFRNSADLAELVHSGDCLRIRAVTRSRGIPQQGAGWLGGAASLAL